MKLFDKFDKQGKPMALFGWAKKFEDMKYRRVGWFQNQSITVSTIWLGLNHSFCSGDKKLIFESMVFVRSKKKEKLGESLTQDRYSTLAEAKKGHKELVKKYKNYKPGMKGDTASEKIYNKPTSLLRRILR